MDLSFFAADVYNSVSHWFAEHGVRVFIVIAVAVIANNLLKFSFSEKKFIPPLLENVPQPKYKNIIGQPQRRRIRTVIRAVKDTLSFVIYMIAAMTILPEFGVNVGPILAGLGLAGLAVGMAARDALTDFLAGFFIIIEGEYNIGDKIEVAGVSGRVSAISLRRTILQGKNGVIHIIPNREIKLIKRYPLIQKRSTNGK